MNEDLHQYLIITANLLIFHLFTSVTDSIPPGSLIMTGVKEIKGFSVLPLRFEPSQKYQPKGNILHYIFYKKHTINSKDQSDLDRASRSLFLVNLPICTNLHNIKKLFGKIAMGAIIESIELANDYEFSIDYTKLTTDLELSTNKTEKKFNLPKTCGVITFLDKSALNLSLQSLKKIDNDEKIPIWEETEEYGSSFFLKRSRDKILDAEETSDLVSKSMVEFDQKEKESIENLQSMKSLVDQDGFTLVVGTHRKTKNGILGKVKLAGTVENEIADKKLKKKEKEDFYRFQLREKKKNEMNDILKKFQEDKERIKIMKEKKRFRPY